MAGEEDNETVALEGLEPLTLSLKDKFSLLSYSLTDTDNIMVRYQHCAYELCNYFVKLQTKSW